MLVENTDTMRNEPNIPYDCNDRLLEVLELLDPEDRAVAEVQKALAQPSLTIDDETILLKEIIAEDIDLIEQKTKLVNHYRFLAIEQAFQYRDYSDSLSDMIILAIEKLEECARTFKPKKVTSTFYSYLSTELEDVLLAYLERQGSLCMTLEELKVVQDEKGLIEKTCSLLSPVELQILGWAIGGIGEKGKDIEEMSRLYGSPPERVADILNKACKKAIRNPKKSSM